MKQQSQAVFADCSTTTCNNFRDSFLELRVQVHFFECVYCHAHVQILERDIFYGHDGSVTKVKKTFQDN